MAIIHLATEIDKTGSTVEIFQTTSLGMSPIYTFFLRHMAELIDNGFAYPVSSWEDQYCEAVYAEQDGKVIGHIVYSTEYIKKQGNLWITLSAVDNGARGKGIYTLLHNHFEQVAKDYGCWAIASHVHKNNKVRLASAEKVGMKPIFHYMGKKLR